MENRIEMVEVFGAQAIQALIGCTVTAVSDAGEGNDEGIFLDCKDADSNRVCFSISEDGSWHFYNSKKKDTTVEQMCALAMLSGCSDIDSISFNNVDPLVEIVIKPIGTNAADRVLTMLREIFPNLEVRNDEWDFEGGLYPTYSCSDPGYNFIISVAVMPENAIKGIGGN